MEDRRQELAEMADARLVSKIFDNDLALKRIDRDFAFKLLDEMIRWDRKTIGGGRVPSQDEVDILFAIQDYFFYIFTRTEDKEIDSYLAPLLFDMYNRVHSKHKNPYYEGFFNALVQMVLFRKLLSGLGEKLWIADWIQRLQNSLNTLRVPF